MDISDLYQNDNNIEIVDCILILLNKLNNNELSYIRKKIDEKIQK